MAAGTLAEALTVAARRNVAGELSNLINGLGFEVASVSSATSPELTPALSSTWAATLPELTFQPFFLHGYT